MKKAFFVSVTILLYSSLLAQTIGSKVSLVAVDGKTYTGKITEIQGDKFKVKYDGFDFDAWLTAQQFQVIQTIPATDNKVTDKQVKLNTGPIKPVASNGKLYFRTFMWMTSFGNSLELSWLFLGNNGTIIKNPKHGVNQVDYAAELADNSANVGKYKLAGNKLMVAWNNGTTSEWKVEYDGAEISAIDGGLVSRPDAMPANYRLNGQFAASAVLPGVSSVQTFVFKKDGTFSLNKLGTVHTNVVGGMSESNSNGTYSISGNTLWLNFNNGEKQVAVIYIWDNPAGKKYLVINNSSFPQEQAF